MMRPTFYYNFFNPNSPPQQVNIRFDNSALKFEDLLKQWPVKKVLTARDINYSQVVMPRDLVEGYILPLLLPEEQNSINQGEQLPIIVRDLDTLLDHHLLLWENGTSYVLTNGWSASFVRRRELEVGEEAGFCWDQRLRVLRFTVLSRPPVGREE